MANQFTVGFGSTDITKPRDANGNILLDGPNQGMVVGKSGMPYVPAGGDDSALRAAREAARQHDMARAASNQQKQAAEKARLAKLVAQRDANLATQGNQGLVVGPTGSGNSPNTNTGSTNTGAGSTPGSTGGNSTGSYLDGVMQAYQHPEAVKSTAAVVTPVTNEVRPNALVQNQINSILDQDNPFIQRRRHSADEVSNSRGLLNSSIAAGAGEASAIDAAMEIASQDANTYREQDLTNQTAQNEAESQNAQLQTNINQNNADAQNRFIQQGYDAQLKLQSMEADTLNRERLMAFDADVRERLAGVEQGYALELENLSQSYEISKNADTAMGVMYSDALKSLATLLQDSKLSSEQRGAGSKVIVDNLQAGLEFLSGVSGSPSTAQYGGGASNTTSGSGSGSTTPVTTSPPGSSIFDSMY